MALQTQAEIQIKGGSKITTFNNLKIRQFMNKHHTFQLEVRKDELLGMGKDPMTAIRDFIGQVILIKITALPDLGSLTGLRSLASGAGLGSLAEKLNPSAIPGMGAVAGMLPSPSIPNAGDLANLLPNPSLPDAGSLMDTVKPELPNIENLPNYTVSSLPFENVPGLGGTPGIMGTSGIMGTPGIAGGIGGASAAGAGSKFTGYFKGIITEAHLRKSSDGGRGEIIELYGSSPTIIMDDGPESHSFENKPLQDIANVVLQDYDSKLLERSVKTRTGKTLPYTVQYKESDFDFLNRMAQRHGEWFYYNGTQLVFGIESKTTHVSLHYGEDLQSFSFSLQAAPTKFKFTSNDNSDGTENKATTQQFENKINGFAGSLLKQSSGIFNKETVVQHNQLVAEGNGQADIQDYADLKLQSAAGKMITLQASSEHPAVRIGATVEILDGDRNTYGRYIVTQVTHRCSDQGDYENTFTAVPHSLIVAPGADPDAIPICESQPAVVFDNNDPKGLGRIRVKMGWQNEKGEATPWIQVISPHGGGGKGFHFIPEKGEKVMVDFQGGNAELPYVIGNMFNTNAKSGFHTQNNDVKAIKTRSGNNLTMNDAAGSVNLADQGKASLYMDGAGNSTINAAASKTINVGKGGESLLKMDSAGNITLNGTTSLKITIGSSTLEMKSDGTIAINGKSITVKGTTSTDISALNNHIGGGPTVIDGGDVFIN